MISPLSHAEVLGELRQRRQELTQLCADLVQIPSENPPGDTTKIASYVRSYLEERGFETQVVEPKKGMPNVVATLGQGRPNLVLSAHMDTFPAGEGWSLPPFSGTLREGRIFGRGAGDMKGGLAVSLFVASLLREMGGVSRGSLTLALVADEETGGRWGAQWLLQNVPAVRGDACLICESSGTWAIGVGETGVLWIRMKATGTSGHASYGLGESAIKKVLAAIGALSEMHGINGQPSEDVATLIRRQRPIVEERWGQGTGERAGMITVNVGTVRGGGQVNLIPDACKAEIDLRVPPGMTTEEVERDIGQRLEQLALTDLDIEIFNRCDPYVTSPNEGLVGLLQRHALEVCGSEALPVVRLGATDGRFFRREGIPTAIYGPAVHNMGGPDEYIGEDELFAVAEVYVRVILDYFGGERSDG